MCKEFKRVNGVGECGLSSCRSYGTCSRNAGGAKEASMATPQIALWLGIRRLMLARLYAVHTCLLLKVRSKYFLQLHKVTAYQVKK